MCTYNGAAFVEAQLEVFSGRHDAPTRSSSATMDRADATVEIVGKIAAKYPGKIQIVKNRSSRGSGGNFENAISLTSGDIIFLADFDDVWFPDKVSTMIEAFARSPEVVLVYSDAVLTDRQLKPTTGWCRFRNGSSQVRPVQRQRAEA
jgi:GT2 family glycosyltransferase